MKNTLKQLAGVAGYGALLTTLAGTAQAKTAQAIAYGKSFQVLPFTLVVRDGSLLRSYPTYVTTYDGQTGTLPLMSPQGVLSAEVRPRAGQPGVYETDFISTDGSSVVAYGSIVLSLPATDANGNGLPDVLEHQQAADVALSGTLTQDWPYSDPQTLSGRMTRQAGKSEGSLSWTAAQNPIEQHATFKLSIGVGTMDYTSGNPGSATFVNHGLDSTSDMTTSGSTTFTVLGPNQVSVPGFTITRNDGKTIRTQSAVLTRQGNQYVGPWNFVDGMPDTTWTDYTDGVLEITDANDADGDGIPDLTDTAAPCSYSLPTGAGQIGAGGGVQSFAIATAGGCAWTASAGVAWLHTSSSGSGSGTVVFTVDTNSTAGFRTGAISAGGQTFTVTQGPAGYDWHRALGWLFVGGSGWKHADGFGWLWFHPGGQWIWSSSLKGWLAVTDPNSSTLWSTQFRWLTPSASDTYRADTTALGMIYVGKYNGAVIPDSWVVSERFGYVWAAGDGIWYYSTELGWLGVTPQGGIWCVNQGRFL